MIGEIYTKRRFRTTKVINHSHSTKLLWQEINKSGFAHLFPI